MTLSDRDIANELGYGELDVSPVDLDEQLQPASLDIRLGKEVSRLNTSDNVVINTRHSKAENYFRSEMISDREGLMVSPDEFYLVNTEENFSIPEGLGAEVRGRSSMGRLGLQVHSTAGWIDPGFEGEITLELSNVSSNPVRIYPGQRIAQVVFYRLESKSRNPYGEGENKYQGQKGAVPSKIHEE